MKKNIKWIVIFAVVSIILECGIFSYNRVVEKIYTKYHFIGNDTINIDLSKADVIDENKEYEKITISNLKTNLVYNIKMTLKSSYDANLYIRVLTDSGEKLLPKANFPSTEFKVYYKNRYKYKKYKFNIS